MTSNKSYGEWGEIFKDHVIAAAVLDRLLHHSTTINKRGKLQAERKEKIGYKNRKSIPVIFNKFMKN